MQERKPRQCRGFAVRARAGGALKELFRRRTGRECVVGSELTSLKRSFGSGWLGDLHRFWFPSTAMPAQRITAGKCRIEFGLENQDRYRVLGIQESGLA